MGYRWRSWGGRVREIEADEVRFHPGYVGFYRSEPDRIEDLVLILAVKESDVADLHPDSEPDPPWWV